MPVDEYRTRHHSGIFPIGELFVEEFQRRFAVGLHPNLPDIFDVSEVQAASITQIAGVARPICLTRRKWEPSDSRALLGAYPDPGRAEKPDHGRRIERVSGKAAGDPGPVVVDHCPAAIMRGRKTPGLFVNP